MEAPQITCSLLSMDRNAASMAEQEKPNNSLHLSLGDRMKLYEAQNHCYLESDSPTIVRLDGHGFSKFTRATFPSSIFDYRFHSAMVSTCFDLLRSHPDISYAYTQSDEITLIFPHGVRAFNGRTDKLLSLTAAHASIRFNARLRADGIEAEHLDVAHFDARVFTVPSQEELLNAVLWRARKDCRRNAVAKYARHYFSSKELLGVNTQEKIDKMQLEMGFAYEIEAPKWVQYGTSVKKEQYEHRGVNPKTGIEEKTMRMRPRADDVEIVAFSEEMVEWVVRKYW